MRRKLRIRVHGAFVALELGLCHLGWPMKSLSFTADSNAALVLLHPGTLFFYHVLVTTMLLGYLKHLDSYVEFINTHNNIHISFL